MLLFTIISIQIISATTQSTTKLSSSVEFPNISQYHVIMFQNFLVSGTDAIVAARVQDNIPPYNFDWVRDSAIAMNAASVHLGKNSTEILEYYERYERFTQLQFKSKPNDGYDIRGDVKFETDGEVFHGGWGRNQNDGPAQRSSIRIDYAHWLYTHNRINDAIALYGPTMNWGSIKWELDYVRQNWSETTFDIWETCQGYHLYTLLVTRKSLYKGAVLAYTLGDYDYAIELLLEVGKVNDAIPLHFNDHDGMIYPMIKTVCEVDRLSLDIVIQLATLYGNIDNSLMNDVQLITKGGYSKLCGSNNDNNNNNNNDQRCIILKSYIDNWEQYGTSYWTQPKPYHHYNIYNLWKLTKWSEQNFPIAKDYIGKWNTTFIARYANDKYSGFDESGGNPWLLANFATSQIWTQFGSYYRPQNNKDKYNTKYIFFPQHIDMWNELLRPLIPKCNDFNNVLLKLKSNEIFSIEKGEWKNTCAPLLRDLFWSRGVESTAIIFDVIGQPNNLTEQLDRNTKLLTAANYLTWSYSSLHFAYYDWVNRDKDFP